ncbi:hypothetical protein B0H21DRAFT_826579 [Amylocystis lapponica]|nr:hypothetical protein B0H21DRAFT_826579 [Amylocystis lapponica]
MPLPFVLPPQAEPKISLDSRVHRSTSPANNRKPTTRGKKSAGKLAQLMQMPVDVFYEIAGHLHFQDLLHLARVSKRFRGIFMSKKSRHLWATARRNVPGVPLPDCPEQLSEPLYASLLYDRICMACGVGRCVNVDYGLRVRFCSACYKANVDDGCSLVHHDIKKQDLRVIYTLVPCKETYHKIGFHPELGPRKVDVLKNMSHDRYYGPELVVVAEWYMLHATLASADELDRFVKERREFSTRIQQWGLAMLQWMRDSHFAKEEAERLASESRKASVIAKLKEMGYFPEDFPENGKWKKHVEAPRELTANSILEEHTTSPCEPTLRGEKEKRKGCTDEPALSGDRRHYAALLAAMDARERDSMPSFSTVCTFPCVQELYDSLYKDDYASEITSEQFDAVRDTILEAAASALCLSLCNFSPRHRVGVHDLDDSVDWRLATQTRLG